MISTPVTRGFAVAAALAGALAAPGAAQSDPPLSQYRTTVLTRNLSDPTSIAFLPDGRIYITRKSGAIRLLNPATGDTSTALNLSVGNAREDGLHSLVLDPGFATNHWVYMLFSNSTRDSIVVARFDADPVSGTISAASRRTLLQVPYTINTTTAEHNTGTLAFGPEGHLYIGLADNTQNIFSGNALGTAPRDPARPLYDAQRSAANSNDLRGKILRIHPEASGAYSIPAGNLFPPGTPNTRPEIYAMGLRHPFRLTVDPQTGWLYWAETGPNASADNYNATSGTGPRGYEEVNLAKTAGNYGWPYCVGDNFCYTHYNFTSNTRLDGLLYNPDSLRNTSPNNTGVTDLPPARPALVWYAYNSTTPSGFPFPMFGNGSSNAGMLGPIYKYDPGSASPGRLPAVFDRHIFIVEWQRSLIFVAKLDSAGGLQNLRSFWSKRDSTSNGPIDVKIGPDGALYLLNWVGTAYTDNSGNGTLTRLEYTGVHTGLAAGAEPRATGPSGDLFFSGPGAFYRIPAGANVAEFYSLRGRRLWTFRRADVTRAEPVLLPPAVRGLVKVRVR